MEELNDQKYVVTFLPWLRLKQPIETPKVIFWLFPSKKDHFPLDKKLKSQLTRMFSSYRDPIGKPAKPFTIASFANAPFKDLSDGDAKMLQDVIRRAAFSLVCENEYYAERAYFNSSHFQHFHQRFQVGSEYTALHTRRREGITWHGGYKHGELRFTMPLQTSTLEKASVNARLLQTLLHLYDEETQEAAAIGQAIDWFFLANSDADSLSWQTETIMMGSAFEALFQVQDTKEKKIALMETLRILFDDCLIEKIERRGSDGKKAMRSWKVWWMDEFYWLRNKIVHGGSIDPTRLVWNFHEHLAIAAIIFALSVKLMLSKRGRYLMRADEEKNADALDYFLAGGKLSKDKLLDARRKAWFERAGEEAWKIIYPNS